MADRCLIDDTPPDAAIHADTQWDPPETMRMVEYLADTLSYPVIVTTGVSGSPQPGRSLLEAIREPVKGYVPIPAFAENAGLGRRQCTKDYKLRPLERKQRELLGLEPGERSSGVLAETWIGISWDETQRMKDARHRWAKNRWPLIELEMTRQDCKDWWAANAPADAPPLARSACIGCPLHSRREWVELNRSYPERMREAAELEAEMNQRCVEAGKERQYFHSRRIPLLEAIRQDSQIVDLQDAQQELNLWDAECEGMCGV